MLCFVPTYVVGLAVGVLRMLQRVLSGGVAPDRTVLGTLLGYVRFLDLPAMLLMVVGVCLSTVVVNRRSDWSDAVIAVVAFVMIGAIAVTLLRIA